jgi:hypothetical protein
MRGSVPTGNEAGGCPSLLSERRALPADPVPGLVRGSRSSWASGGEAITVMVAMCQALLGGFHSTLRGAVGSGRETDKGRQLSCVRRSWADFVQSSRPSGAAARSVDKILPSPSVRLVHTSRLKLGRPESVDTNRRSSAPTNRAGGARVSRPHVRLWYRLRSGGQMSGRMSLRRRPVVSVSSGCLRCPTGVSDSGVRLRCPAQMSGSADAGQSRPAVAATGKSGKAPRARAGEPVNW